jgi:hypothetical protein
MKKALLFIPFCLLLFILSPLVTQPVHAASPIKTVFIILMENHDWSAVKGSASPYITNTLLPMGAHAENYRNGDVHPSAPNYVSLEAGSPVVGTADCAPTDSGCSSSGPHLSKLLDAAGVPWKEYAEDANGTSCILDFSTVDVNHVPFSYFTDVTNNNSPTSANCIAHERPFTELATDLANNTVARYNFITPNLTDDMHDGTVQQGDTWLSQNVPTIMNSQAYKNGGVIIVAWDEDSGADNPIGFIVLSQFAKVNYSNTIAYSHASTLRTMEEIFGVSPFLGNAATATDLSDLFTVPLTGTSGPAPTSPPNPTAVAPTAITPTLFCVGGSGVPPCATIPPNAPTSTTSIAPTGGNITTIAPTQNPCTTTSTVSIMAEKKHTHTDGTISNLLLQLLQLLLQLISQLLGTPITIPTNPTPGPTTQPTMPNVSTVPPVSGQPTTTQPNPCVTPTTSITTAPPAAASPSMGVTTNPTTTTAGNTIGPKTSLHYTGNSNFSGNTFSPGAFGFNLTDAESTTDVTNTPTGDKALVWIGQCNGADTTFTSTVQPYIGNAKVYGFYLMDEPDPPSCPQANLKAESDWIHTNDPGAKTFIILDVQTASSNPSYANTYNPSNSDLDLYGLDPYPCRTELNGCDYTYITKAVAAAQSAGVPPADIVPVYQTFGLGGYTDDGGGQYGVPTAAQEQQILSTWASVVPNPVFDYAYSWGTQNGDTSLSSLTDLQQIFVTHNK